MYSPIFQLIIGTLLGIGFLTVSAFIIAVCFFWLLAWTLPVAWRVWSLWKAFSAYRRGESVMVSAVSAISPRAAFWLPRLSAVIFHLLGRPAPPNWRAQTPPSFAEAAHVAQHESGQREGVPNAAWIRQAERDRMMATRNEGHPSNVYSVPPPSVPSAEAAEGGWMVEAAISAIQFIQNAAQQLMEKLRDYSPNAQQQQSFRQQHQYAQQDQSFDTPNRRSSEASSAPSSQDSVMGGVKRRHPYPQFHEDPDSSNYYATPQPSAPST